MKRWLLVSLVLFPVFCFAGSEIGPEGNKLLYFFAFLVLIPFFIWIRSFIRHGKPDSQRKMSWAHQSKLLVLLKKDRPLRPKVLTLTVRNMGKSEVDIKQPVLVFRKFWSVRRFALKGINGKQIYPLYLQKGDTHELNIETSVFHQYDKSIRKYYWARILVIDVRGRKFRSNYVKLRKSLLT